MTMVVVSLHTQCLDECGDFRKIWKVFGDCLGAVISTCSDPRKAAEAVEKLEEKAIAQASKAVGGGMDDFLESLGPSMDGIFGATESAQFVDAKKNEVKRTAVQARQDFQSKIQDVWDLALKVLTGAHTYSLRRQLTSHVGTPSGGR